MASYDEVYGTIRHTNCLLLMDGSSLCSHCKRYKKNSLNKLLSRALQVTQSNKENVSSHVNYRFMDSESKDIRMKRLKEELRKKKIALQRLEKKLREVIQKDAMPVDNTLHSDLLEIMEKQKLSVEDDPSNKFKEIFWKQQLQAFSKSNPKSVRWHPMIIKLCLYIHYKSSGAYETLRSSGVIKLPSGRTLRDYRHFAPVSVRLSSATDKQLLDLANKNSPLARHVILLLDEMYVKEGLVFNKNTGSITGFVDLGDLNNHFIDLENAVASGRRRTHRPLAKTLLVFMVRGAVTNYVFPYALYPSASPRGCDLFAILWDVIERLTRNNFHILAVTCDGAACNRSLFKLHSTKRGLVYKTLNVFSANKEWIYFIADPPHLLKTTRNCLASSKRNLWVSRVYNAPLHTHTLYYYVLQCQGQTLGWRHIIDLYNRNMGAATGLSMVPKLKYEHVYLNSFSKMCVDLAAQVLHFLVLANM